jgi:hypothetical protein
MTNSVKLYMEKSFHSPVQDDSLGEGLKFTIMHYVIIYHWKQNVASTNYGRYGYNWDRQDVDIGSPPPGDKLT